MQDEDMLTNPDEEKEEDAEMVDPEMVDEEDAEEEKM